jgi:hypothetical protein
MSDILVNNKTGGTRWPASFGSLRAFSGVSIGNTNERPVTAGDYTLHRPVAVERPVGDVVTEICPVLVDGAWTQKWEARAYNADEIARLIEEAKQEVTDQRNEKINAGVMFDGVLYQSDPDSRENVNGAYSRANAVKAKGGGLPGDYRWFHADYDFSYTAADNTEHLMDADAIIAMGDAFSDRKMVLIKFAQAVKAGLSGAKSKAEIDRISGGIVWP